MCTGTGHPLAREVQHAACPCLGDEHTDWSRPQDAICSDSLLMTDHHGPVSTVHYWRSITRGAPLRHVDEETVHTRPRNSPRQNSQETPLCRSSTIGCGVSDLGPAFLALTLTTTMAATGTYCIYTEYVVRTDDRARQLRRRNEVARLVSLVPSHPCWIQPSLRLPACLHGWTDLITFGIWCSTKPSVCPSQVPSYCCMSESTCY